MILQNELMETLQEIEKDCKQLRKDSFLTEYGEGQYHLIQIVKEIESKKVILRGRMTKAAHYNTGIIFNELPVKSRNQIIEVVLDDDFPEIVFLKNDKVKIIVDKEE